MNRLQKNKNKDVLIIGGGSAGLFSALRLSEHFNVTIIDQMKSVGRKFLIAGKGGFNLTNSLEGKLLAKKYRPKEFLYHSIIKYDSKVMRDELRKLGIETFVGSSGRVFPIDGIQPAEVLNKIKNKIVTDGAKIITNLCFDSIVDNKTVIVKSGNNIKKLSADYIIFALGGASWQQSGSDGKWIKIFNNFGISTNTFKPSNCGVNINWKQSIIDSHLGKPLKNISLSIDETVSKGEALITEYGLEGNAVYPLIHLIREKLEKNNECVLKLDLKPFNNLVQLANKLGNHKLSTNNYSKYLNLASHEMALIKSIVPKNEFLNKNLFLSSVKSLRININSLRPINEAISTVGGINCDELNIDFSLKKSPNMFTIGEMVDWDAPTGGFLLQGCFSMAQQTASSIIEREIKC